MNMTAKHVFLIVPRALLPARVDAAERTNILLIVADDCTYRDLEVYGGQATEMKALERMPGGSRGKPAEAPQGIGRKEASRKQSAKPL
ncbi:MAG: hypothetical protein FJ276_20915 [Planctomycetes bacterium]|nr:hypothetical protein [Planctomycetota bacterium]